MSGAGAESGAAHASPVLASIWAQDRRGVLGSGTGMLWHVPADFAHFKATTMGCPIIMGRASWESLGAALPGRDNIVITHRPDYLAAGAHVVHSLVDAVDLGKRLARGHGAPVVWITGGAHVYAEAMSLVDQLVITHLDLDVADAGYAGPVVAAPRIDPEVWTLEQALSDTEWRPVSGDARWRIATYVRDAPLPH